MVCYEVLQVMDSLSSELDHFLVGDMSMVKC